MSKATGGLCPPACVVSLAHLLSLTWSILGSGRVTSLCGVSSDEGVGWQDNGRGPPARPGATNPQLQKPLYPKYKGIPLSLHVKLSKTKVQKNEVICAVPQKEWSSGQTLKMGMLTCAAAHGPASQLDSPGSPSSASFQAPPPYSCWSGIWKTQVWAWTFLVCYRCYRTRLICPTRSKPYAEMLRSVAESLFTRQPSKETGEVSGPPPCRQKAWDIYGIKKQGGLRRGERWLEVGKRWGNRRSEQENWVTCFFMGCVCRNGGS